MVSIATTDRSGSCLMSTFSLAWLCVMPKKSSIIDELSRRPPSSSSQNRDCFSVEVNILRAEVKVTGSLVVGEGRGGVVKVSDRELERGEGSTGVDREDGVPLMVGFTSPKLK